MFSNSDIKSRCKTIRSLWSLYLRSNGAKKEKITLELRDICRELYNVKIKIQSCDSGYNDSCQDIVNIMKKYDTEAYLYIQENENQAKYKCCII